MHSLFTLTSLCALLGTTVAYQQVSGLMKRQDQSYEPGVIPSDCDPDDGYVMCGESLCYLPSQGDVCCDPSQEWACGGGSFCLVNGRCCPKGLDPETCAADYGISLPGDFSTNPVGTPTYSATPSSTPPSSTPVYPTPTTPTSSPPPVFTGAANRMEGGALAMGLMMGAAGIVL